MTPLESLSRIGFGTRKATIESAEHRDALEHALDSGCNLVDTASHYMLGNAELLVGEVLRAGARERAFVVTKAGSVGAFELQRFCGISGLPSEVVTTRSGGVHCIHPDFLRAQLDQSLERLGCEHVDGLLLYKPERYFQQDRETAPNELYRRIERAFATLEREVERGCLRYYGVSSEKLTAAGRGSLDLSRLVATAERVRTDHHFKLVQFPFNFLETGASERRYGKSLVEESKRYGLRSLTSRPLRARSEGAFVHLAARAVDEELLNPESSERVVQQALRLLDEQLRRGSTGEDSNVAAMLAAFQDRWNQTDSPESADELFESFFYPLLARIYGRAVPAADFALYRELQRRSRACAVARMNVQAQALRSELVRRGVIRQQDSRPLDVIACESYLRSGVDHVLVGMRRREYVEKLRPFLGKAVAA